MMNKTDAKLCTTQLTFIYEVLKAVPFLQSSIIQTVMKEHWHNCCVVIPAKWYITINSMHYRQTYIMCYPSD